MISGFEEHTQPLNRFEQEVVAPWMATGLIKRVGEANAITSKEICEAMNGLKRTWKGQDVELNIRDADVRRIVAFIRHTGMVPCLMAGSKGYWVASSQVELSKYIASLQQRATAINAVADSLFKQLSDWVEKDPATT